MKYLSKLTILMPFVIFFYSCSTTSNVETVSEETNESTNSLIISDYNSLNKQLDSSWTILNGHEVEKLELIKRLISEISYNPKHNPIDLKKLATKTEIVQDKLLKPEMLKNDDVIDQYDILIDSLIEESISIVEKTPEMENYQNVESLVIEINNLNTDVVLSDRTTYSMIVSDYNNFIDSNKVVLKNNNLNTEKKGSFFLSE